MKNDLFNIAGKVAILTGGGGVLAGTMAKYLLKHNVRVALLDLNTDAIKLQQKELNEYKHSIIGFETSVLDKKQLEEVREKILKKWGRIDLLINAAGGNMPGATIGEDQTIFDLKIEDFHKVSQLNLEGTVLPSIVFGETMAKQKEGNIINISSMTAYQAITRVVGYSASKAAISNFTQWLATELALKFGESLRVNAIAPGFFIGNQNRTLLTNPDGSYTERGNKIINKTPMKRFGEAEELNGTIHWLMSKASQFVTGVIIPIDGGFNAYSGV